VQQCPHCSAEIRVRELPHPGLLQDYRICPKCGGSFTADADTKYRQALFIVVALISLVFTLFLYFEDTAGWLIPALSSYIVLGLLLYWGNKKVFFVPYNKGKYPANDT
jgi:hypothetical protein